MKPWARRLLSALVYTALGLAIAVGSMWAALLVTPTQDLTAAGQPVSVGAATPTFSLSGPGEITVFRHTMPTHKVFNGAIRPKFSLDEETPDFSPELKKIIDPASRPGAMKDLGAQLKAGWTRYFIYESLLVLGFALVFTLALVGLRMVVYWRVPHERWGRRAALVLGCAVLAVSFNVSAVLVLARDVPRVLASVHSLTDLVGTAPLAETPPPVGPPQPGAQVVVIGDSTAAGKGNPLVANPSDEDKACERSRSAFAVQLAKANGWNVLNLACSSATIATGILGVQWVGGKPVPPQFGVLEEATNARYVIVSIGANDMMWSSMVSACAAAPRCDDKVSKALFDTKLNTFTANLLALYTHLSQLPSHPRVIVNLYYQPFGPNVDCLVAPKVGSINQDKRNVLAGRLDQVNTVLNNGAKSFGFTVAKPNFSGNELCEPTSFVQGIGDPGPLHPTPAGELAIALADQRAIDSIAGGGRLTSSRNP